MAQVLQQTDSLHSKLDARRLEQFVHALDALAPLPSLARRALAMMMAHGPEASDAHPEDAREFIELAGVAPSMTAGLLALANRRGGRAAATVADAVEKVGFGAVRAAVLSGRVFTPPTEAGLHDSGLDQEEFWKHCLAVAAGAQMLAERMGGTIDPEEAFVCGLLHDIGKLALSQGLPKSYRRAWDAAAKHDGNIADYEREIIGVDHSAAGLHLAQEWRLGAAIETVAWLAHQPPEAVPDSIPDRMMVQVVALADTIARECGLGNSGNFTFARDSTALAAALGAGEAASDISAALKSKVEGYVARFAADRPSGDGQATYERALADANAELGRLNEQLRRQAESVAGRARAVGRLCEFAGAIRPDASVPDVLAQIADTVAAEAGITPTRAEPVVTYCIGPPDVGVTLSRSAGRELPDLRACERNPVLEDGADGARERSAAAAMSAILADPELLGEWLDLAAYRHWGLTCGDRWIGGVLYPASDPAGVDGSADVSGPLDQVMAMALAMARGRSSAMRLSEQLAGTSRALAAAQDALAEAKTLAAVGELAAGAGHELNNPLAVISGRAQLMRERAETKEERKTWKQIAEQAQRISDVITDLMEFASPRPPDAEALEAVELLRDVADAFAASRHPKRRAARIDIAAPGEGTAVLADRDQIHAAFLELVTNAATAGGDEPDIRLSAEVDEAGKAVLLTVSDNGPGMAPETLSRAFTPFFSDQEAGRRRGLGLPRARRYVVNNGGKMWIRTRVGEGTTVYVQLPRACPPNGACLPTGR